MPVPCKPAGETSDRDGRGEGFKVTCPPRSSKIEIWRREGKVDVPSSQILLQNVLYLCRKCIVLAAISIYKQSTENEKTKGGIKVCEYMVIASARRKKKVWYKREVFVCGVQTRPAHSSVNERVRAVPPLGAHLLTP